MHEKNRAYMYADIVVSSHYQQEQHTCDIGDAVTDAICLNGKS